MARLGTNSKTGRTFVIAATIVLVSTLICGGIWIATRPDTIDIHFSSDPVGASIYVDGSLVGNTGDGESIKTVRYIGERIHVVMKPSSGQLKPTGKSFTLLDLRQSEPARIHIKLQENSKEVISVEEEIKYPPLEVKLTTHPTSLRLEADGVLVNGNSPYHIKFEKGQNQLTLVASRKGYHTQTKILLRGEMPKEVTLSLKVKAKVDKVHSTPRPVQTPRPAWTPKPVQTPRPAWTPKPVQTPRPKPDPTPTRTPRPKPDPTPTRTPRPKPAPKSTPSMSPSPSSLLKVVIPTSSVCEGRFGKRWIEYVAEIEVPTLELEQVATCFWQAKDWNRLGIITDIIVKRNNPSGSPHTYMYRGEANFHSGKYVDCVHNMESAIQTTQLDLCGQIFAYQFAMKCTVRANGAKLKGASNLKDLESWKQRFYIEVNGIDDNRLKTSREKKCYAQGKQEIENHRPR